MEARKRNTKAARLAANLVQREEANIAVEERVLEALRHDRAGQLLEAAPEAIDERDRCAPGPAGRHGAEQHRAQELMHAAVRQCGDRLRFPQHVVYERTILAGEPSRRDVGAVDRERTDQVA